MKTIGVAVCLVLMPAVSQARITSLNGIASWYGPGCHGRLTSSGERFDQNSFTLACKSLPLGTKVRITNLENGKQCTGRINDRGPGIRGRRFDVSKAIARKLGFVQRGKARINIKTIREVKISYGDEPM